MIIRFSKHPLLLFIGYLIALFTLIGVAIFSQQLISKLINNFRLSSNAQTVLINFAELSSLLQKAELNGQRYLIANSQEYLDRYKETVNQISVKVTAIKNLTTHNSLRHSQSIKLESLIKELPNYSEQNTLSDSATAPQTNLYMSRVLSQIEEMRTQEEIFYERYSAEVNRTGILTNQIITAGSFFAIALIVLIGWILFKEINKRVQVESEIKKHMDELEDLYNHSPCGYYSLDENGLIVKANQTWLDWLGFKKEEVIGKKHLTEIIRPDHINFFKDTFDKFKQSGVINGIECEYRGKDGNYIPVSVSATAIKDADGRYLMSRNSVFDMSDIKRVEQDLRQSNLFLNSLIDNIPNMIFVKDAKALRFIRFNKAGEELVGYGKNELLGKNDYDFFPSEEAEAFIAKDQEVLRLGKLVDIPEEPIHTRHQGLRILHTKKIPLFDNDGNPEYLLGISEDITDRREAEIEIQKLNQDLINHANQLEVTNRELESFSYSISHDLRAPLRAIDGFSKLLLQGHKNKLDDQAQRWLNVIRNNTKKMSMLIDDLLAFSRVGRNALNTTIFDMDLLVEECLQEITEELDTNVEIRKSSLGNAEGDRALLKQVWANLLSNAIKYSSKKEHPVVEISLSSENEGAIYAVKDNGIGFDMKYYNKLFGVFERLHAAEEFPGTGVGLAIAQRITAKHGGKIWAVSKMEEETIFYFTLGKSTEVKNVPS